MPQRKSKVEMVAMCTKRMLAIDEHVPQKAQIRISNGVVHKVSQVRATYQAAIDTRTELATAQAGVKAAQAAVAEADAQVHDTERALAPWVQAQFGVDSPQAIAFGFVEKTRAVRPLAEKVCSAELGRATRKARGTVGPKEKAKIKGVLPAIAPVSEAPAKVRVTNGVAPQFTNGVAPQSTNGVAHP